MKKSLLAMAMVSAFAAPAFAQNVEVYGVVDVGVQQVDNGTTNVVDMKSGGQSESRLGFKGGENLGGGLKAEFVLETGVDLTNGAQDGTLFGRQSWVGLSSESMGSVRLGRQLTSGYNTAYAVDPFKLGMAGNAGEVLGGATLEKHLDKAVTYVSPSMGGFKGEVQYGFGGSEKESDNRTLTLSGSYTAGPLMVAALRGTKNLNDGLDAKKTETMIGGTYDLQKVKLHAAWSESKLEEKSFGIDDKTKSYLLGVSAPVGVSGTVMASWNHNKVDNLADSSTDMYSVGYSHVLSKRTNVYASYSYTNNDNNAWLSGAVEGGKDVNKVGVGVRHSF